MTDDLVVRWGDWVENVDDFDVLEVGGEYGVVLDPEAGPNEITVLFDDGETRNVDPGHYADTNPEEVEIDDPNAAARLRQLIQELPPEGGE